MRGSEFSGERYGDSATAWKALLQSMLSHEGFTYEAEKDMFGLGSVMMQVKNLKMVLRGRSAARHR